MMAMIGDCKSLSRAFVALLLTLGIAGTSALAADAPSVAELARQIRTNDHDGCWQAIAKLAELAAKSEEARAALLAAMDHADELVRGSAAQAWMESGVDPNKIVPFLTHAEAQFRYWAAKTLIAANHSVPASVAALLELQREPVKDYSWAENAEDLFLAFGPSVADAAVPVLCDTLQRNNYRVRTAAIDCLKNLAPPTAAHVPSLVGLLRYENEEVQLAAIELLQDGGPDAQAAIGPLREMLKSTRWRVSLAAAAALGTISPNDQDYLPVLVRALADPDLEVRSEAAGHLASVGRDAQGVVAALIEDLHDTGGAPARALIHIGKSVAPELSRILPTHPGARTREQAAWILGELGPDAASNEVIRALIQGLGDQDLNVRLEAVTALGKLGPKAHESAAPITALLQRDALITRPAGEALSRIGPLSEKTSQVLIRRLGDADPYVRIAAARGLAETREAADAVLPVLSTMINEEKPAFCCDALEVLQRMGKSTAPAVPQLVRALAFKGGVSNGLGGQYIAPQASWALTAIGPAAVPALIKVLEDPSPQVRGLAADALGQMGVSAEPAVAALVSRLDDDGRYDMSCGCLGFRPTVRERAILALGKIGPPAKAVLPRLIESLKASSERESESLILLEGLVKALHLIGPRDAGVAAGFGELLRSSQQRGDESGAPLLKLALLRAAPESPQNVDHVRELLANFNREISSPYWLDDFTKLADGIVSLGDRGKEFHPILREFFQTKPLMHAQYRVIAASALLRINPDDREARAYLLRMARSHEYYSKEAAQETLQATAQR